MGNVVEPRGVRNRNPGNLKWSSDNWQGLVDRTFATDSTFCQFVEPVYGIRAMVRVLDNYRTKHGLHTVRDIIHRWAPPTENASDIYAQAVAHDLGVSVGEYVDTADPDVMRSILGSIIRFENGTGPAATRSTWYSDETLDAAIAMARGSSSAGKAAGGAGAAVVVGGAALVSAGASAWAVAGVVAVTLVVIGLGYYILRDR